MKTIALTIATMFVSIQMFAAGIIFNGTSEKAYRVILNNEVYNSHNGEVVIENLEPGMYKVGIEAMYASKNPNKNVTTYTTIEVPRRATVYCDVFPNNDIEIAEVVKHAPAKTVYVNTYETYRAPVYVAPRVVYHAPVYKSCHKPYSSYKKPCKPYYGGGHYKNTGTHYKQGNYNSNNTYSKSSTNTTHQSYNKGHYSKH